MKLMPKQITVAKRNRMVIVTFCYSCIHFARLFASVMLIGMARRGTGLAPYPNRGLVLIAGTSHEICSKPVRYFTGVGWNDCRQN